MAVLQRAVVALRAAAASFLERTDEMVTANEVEPPHDPVALWKAMVAQDGGSVPHVGRALDSEASLDTATGDGTDADGGTDAGQPLDRRLLDSDTSHAAMGSDGGGSGPITVSPVVEFGPASDPVGRLTTVWRNRPRWLRSRVARSAVASPAARSVAPPDDGQRVSRTSDGPEAGSEPSPASTRRSDSFPDDRPQHQPARRPFLERQLDRGAWYTAAALERFSRKKPAIPKAPVGDGTAEVGSPEPGGNEAVVTGPPERSAPERPDATPQVPTRRPASRPVSRQVRPRRRSDGARLRVVENNEPDPSQADGVSTEVRFADAPSIDTSSFDSPSINPSTADTAETSTRPTVAPDAGEPAPPDPIPTTPPTSPGLARPRFQSSFTADEHRPDPPVSTRSRWPELPPSFGGGRNAAPWPHEADQTGHGWDRAWLPPAAEPVETGTDAFGSRQSAEHQALES